MADTTPILYYCPEQEKLAREIAELDPRIKLGTTRGTYKGREQLRRFPDGTPDIVIDGWQESLRVNVAYLASFHDISLYFEQIATMVTLREMTTERFTMILPFFPTATMDRSDFEGRVITSQVMAKMLKIVPEAGTGVTELVIYDPHIKQLRGYFGGAMRIEFKHPFHKHFIPIINEKMGTNWVVLHPDDGSVKRLGHFPNEIVCGKQRVSGGDPIVVIKEGNPEGMDCLIPDDLVQSAGTLIKAMEAAKRAGARSVSVAFTHAVCPGGAPERLKKAGFANVFFSNSNPYKYQELLSLDMYVTEVPTEMVGISLARSMANVITDAGRRAA